MKGYKVGLLDLRVKVIEVIVVSVEEVMSAKLLLKEVLLLDVRGDRVEG